MTTTTATTTATVIATERMTRRSDELGESRTGFRPLLVFFPCFFFS
jgi:hypothetical protein